MSADGTFFSRWSQRKALVRQGVVLPPEPVAADARPARLDDALAHACLDKPALEQAGAGQALAAPVADQAAVEEPAAAEIEPPPTLAEAQALTPSSDFTRFVAPGVDSRVKNAALKQLFRDPHFNVMDRLDTYIDDYGKPDPLPASMLRQMVQAHALGLFNDEAPATPDIKPATEPASELATEPATEPATETDTGPERLAQTLTETHENADLRLQPHDAPGWPGAEPGTEPDTRRTS